ncbi:MAG TPA: enoyl-CoA hydratase-related protein, partial [Acidimicrobiia bacterium]|nr:enoyl-CoA hydratase-related protein [Acidimicrobiia bacterium]
MNLTHFKLEPDDDGVAIVTIDRADDKINTLDPALMEDFESILARIEDDAQIRAVVLTSAKEDNFLAGANIKWFAELADPAAASAAIRQGHALFDRLERVHADLGKPVIAAIHGACLGGGNELVLACSGRIATDHPKTQLGQPEVQLGVLPAGGGTQRLPALIGIAAALDLLLGGRPVSAGRARKLGLVDEAVPPTMLMEIARRRAIEAIAGGDESSRRSWLTPSQVQRLALEANPIGRAVLFRQARRKLLTETKGNYPAPERTLEAVRIGVEEGREAGLAAEARFFGELVTSPESRALRS